MAESRIASGLTVNHSCNSDSVQWFLFNKSGHMVSAALHYFQVLLLRLGSQIYEFHKTGVYFVHIDQIIPPKPPVRHPTYEIYFFPSVQRCGGWRKIV